MSEPPMVKSMNFSEAEARPVLGPAGNKARSVELRKPALKPKSDKTQKPPVTDNSKGDKSPAALHSPQTAAAKVRSPVGLRKSPSSAASILRQRHQNLSLNASCSSDASTESSHSRASTGRIMRRAALTTPPSKRKQQCSLKGERIEMAEGNGKSVGSECDVAVLDGSLVKKRCAWVTSNTGMIQHLLHDVVWISFIIYCVLFFICSMCVFEYAYIVDTKCMPCVWFTTLDTAKVIEALMV